MVALRGLLQHGIVETVNFIFDEEGAREQKRILDAWHLYRWLVENAPKEWREYETIKKMIGDPPDFRNDKKVLPLQAADLFAWHARQFSEWRARGESYDHLAWQSLRSIEGPHRDWTSDDLKGVAAQAHKIMAGGKQRHER